MTIRAVHVGADQMPGLWHSTAAKGNALQEHMTARTPPFALAIRLWEKLAARRISSDDVESDVSEGGDGILGVCGEIGVLPAEHL